MPGSVAGNIANALLQVTLASFALDELRLSSVARPLAGVPSDPFLADESTLFLDHGEAVGKPARLAANAKLATTARGYAAEDCGLVEGKFGRGLGCSPVTAVERLAQEGKRIVIFHENWSRYQGYPDLAQVAKLKRLAEACHRRGMLFLVYFCQLMSDAAPEWPGLADDFMALPERMWYHRDDVKQDCYVSCVNGPYGDLLLDGIAKLADQAGIDGVYMDGTTVPWDCENPTHPGCAQYLGDGSYLARQPIRATREFMKRLRRIFAQRRKVFFLDAHTGGCINIATQSFCDGYYDGEHLARYKPGFRLAPDAFLAGYMGKQFGFRGDFLPSRHTTDQALAVGLVHDTATRGQAPAVDLAWAPYEDTATHYLPYWEHSPLYRVQPPQVLGSLYLKPDRALLVLGSQTEAEVTCRVEVRALLRQLPASVTARDAVTGEALRLGAGHLSLAMPGRAWRMIEVRK
jgi:hypothetical protein